jgi:BASS family bile acid:Na+ symporter
MDACLDRYHGLSRFVHGNFLWLLIGSYALAAFVPSPGLWLRDVDLGHVALAGADMRVSLSMLMLSVLLFNAGLGVDPTRLRDLGGSLRLLSAGLAANVLAPILFIILATLLISRWHNAEEVQNILVGMAVVASMPIAGSSTAWTQNAEGDLRISVGLILFSTLLSPITTPLALHTFGLFARGEHAQHLDALASGVTGLFLGLCVIVPSLVGLGARWLAGDARYAAVKPQLKLINCTILLLLNYANAATSLPQVVADPDGDFLVLILAVVVGLCGLAFTAGWTIARALGATPAERTSLMFGLGMNNNGTGLVLASMTLGGSPRILLPIIVYTLVQHLAAGIVERHISHGPPSIGRGRFSPRSATRTQRRLRVSPPFLPIQRRTTVP